MPLIRGFLLIVPLILCLSVGIIGAAETPALSADDYIKHRQAFQDRRQQLATSIDRLDAALDESRAELQSLQAQRSRLEELLAQTPPERLPVLREISRRIEAAAVPVLQPAPVLAARTLNSGEDSAAQQDLSGAAPLSRYVSFLLPVSVLLGMFVLGQRYPEFYASRRRPVQITVLALLLLLPLSSLAQESSTAAGKSTANGSAALADMLVEADALLGLSRVQRYIRQLSAPALDGRSFLVAGVDLSATPFPYFERVIVGTGEHHATLAALHLADGNKPAAIQQFDAFARAQTPFMVKRSDPPRFELLIASAVLFLLDNDATELAERILRLHLRELRSAETFALIYPGLLGNGLRTMAGEFAQGLIDESSDAGQLIGYAAVLYDSASTEQARASLYKAMNTVASGSSLAQLIEIALAQREADALVTALLMAPVLIDDLALFVDIAGQLRQSGRESAAVALLEDVIERTAEQDVSTVNGLAVDATEALIFLSYESFARGWLDVAEDAAVAAIKPLSRVERSELRMPAPPGVFDPMRVPEPDKLVAPLYFGLLYENQGRQSAATHVFAREIRSLIERMLVSDGLYEPDMLNHLSLLGSRLSQDGESAELLRLDPVLRRLEQAALDEIRASLSEDIGIRQSLLDSREAEIAEVQAQIDALERQLQEDGASSVGVAFSAIMLTLRNLALLGICAFCAVVIVALALRHAEGKGAYQSYAFWWKLVEGMGWIWVLSLLSAPLGILAIVTAQFFLLYQSKMLVAAPAAGPDDRRSAADSEVRPERDWDPDWENVIQVMREEKHRGAV